MTDLDHAAESGQGFFIDLFVGKQFRIVEEIAKEPAELPHGILGAVETPDDGKTDKVLRFENGEPKDIERLLRVPAELGTVDEDEEDAIGQFESGITGSFDETGNLALHATASCFGRA